MHKAVVCLLFAAAVLPGQQARTEEEFKAALSQARTMGQVQDALLGLNQIYRRERRWDDEAAALQKLVDFWSERIQKDSVGTARYSAELAEALDRAGDRKAAEHYLRSAIVIFDKKGLLYEAASVAAKRRLAGTLRAENKLQGADELAAALPPPLPPQGKTTRFPQILSRQEPAYTEDARRHKVNGTVLLSFVVDERGVPSDITVLAPLGFGLDESAIKTVSKWRFQPADLNGSPVSTRATVEVSFRLL